VKIPNFEHLEHASAKLVAPTER